jgi:hypothetical protein
MLGKSKIKFCATDRNFIDVWPHPKPASRFIPDSYKKLERFKKGDMFTPTVKVCMPFLDALTVGYIIPFDQDYLIDPVKGDSPEKSDFSIVPASRKKEDIGFHNQVQLPEGLNKQSGENTGKFINKWLIKTRPGYSCLFVPPLNRFDDRIEIISGVVDTDIYINAIHFPFILKKRDKQFLIKKGEPMVQVIPFKREPYKMWSGFYKEKKHGQTLNKLMSEWVDKYKKYFWHKKEYK